MVRLDEDLDTLATLSPADLRDRWRRVTGHALPKVSPALLRFALGYALQAKAKDGLSRQTRQRLAQLATAKTATQVAAPGTRLVREWNGNVHVVTIGEDGTIDWNDRSWRSLSAVARAITGTRWSEPAFFGLKRKTAADPGPLRHLYAN